MAAALPYLELRARAQAAILLYSPCRLVFKPVQWAPCCRGPDVLPPMLFDFFMLFLYGWTDEQIRSLRSAGSMGRH